MPFGASRPKHNQDDTASPNAPAAVDKPRGKMRIGIPRTLNQWSTHQFWVAFFDALGIGKVDFSSDTSEAQMRKYGRGRVAYPVDSG